MKDPQTDQAKPWSPCDAPKDEIGPAKLWELLRRNEKFKRQVQKLKRLRSASQTPTPDAKKSAKARSKEIEARRDAHDQGRALIQRFDASNSFAAVALMWLVPEPEFRVERYQVSKEKTRSRTDKKRAFLARLENIGIGRGTTPDSSDDQHWRWFGSSSQENINGGLNRWGPRVRRVTDREDTLLPSRPDELQEWRQFFSGGREFNLKTAWPNTPPQFRREFSDCWKNLRGGPMKIWTTDFFQEWALDSVLARAHKAIQECHNVILNLIATIDSISRKNFNKSNPRECPKVGSVLERIEVPTFRIQKIERVRCIQFDVLRRHMVLAATPPRTTADAAALGQILTRALQKQLEKGYQTLGTEAEWQDFLRVERALSEGGTSVGTALRTVLFRDYVEVQIKRNKDYLKIAPLIERWWKNGHLLPLASGSTRCDRANRKRARALVNPLLRKAQQSYSTTIRSRYDHIKSLIAETFPVLGVNCLFKPSKH